MRRVFLASRLGRHGWMDSKRPLVFFFLPYDKKKQAEGSSVSGKPREGSVSAWMLLDWHVNSQLQDNQLPKGLIKLEARWSPGGDGPKQICFPLVLKA